MKYAVVGRDTCDPKRLPETLVRSASIVAEIVDWRGFTAIPALLRSNFQIALANGRADFLRDFVTMIDPMIASMETQRKATAQ